MKNKVCQIVHCVFIIISAVGVAWEYFARGATIGSLIWPLNLGLNIGLLAHYIMTNDEEDE